MRPLAVLVMAMLSGCNYPSAAEAAPLKISNAWALAAFVGFLLCLTVSRRARQLKDRRAVRLEERNRIVRELHDTLLQSTEGLILKVHTVVQQLPPEDPTRIFLARSIEQAENLAIEGRQKLLGLSSPSRCLPELSQALAALDVEDAAGRAVDLAVERQGRVRAVAENVREEIFAVAREAIGNGAKHAHGSRIEVTVSYGFSTLTVQVRDDGCGLSMRQASGARDGRLGLRGMFERAKQLSAHLVIKSADGAGTIVTLVVPSQIAYRNRFVVLGYSRLAARFHTLSRDIQAPEVRSSVG